ncbi:MAG: hypothetical protein ACREGB_01770 [Candidatus Saccharimonadales bacterium]
MSGDLLIVGEVLNQSFKWLRVEYNPYLYDSFVFTDTKKPVYNARWVKLTPTGCYVSEDKK